jgi:Protein of unknown function (DUF2924)
MKSGSNGTVEESLEALRAMDRSALAERWTEVFGSPVPARCRAPLLRGALAWHVQACALTGIRDPHKARARIFATSRASPRPRSTTPGTILVREWQGRRYTVTVQADGFYMDGKRYRSLSALARQITGTAWSGNRFFGLKS